MMLINLNRFLFQSSFIVLACVILASGAQGQSGVSVNPADATIQVIDGQIFGPGFRDQKRMLILD